MAQNPSTSGRSAKIERIIFYGSDSFATPSFEALVAADYKIVALVAEPARVKGRGPDGVAGAWRLPILEPEDLASRELEKKLRGFAPDVQIVVGFESALPKALIDVAPRGTIKAHPSLLPRHRGSHPIPAAILSGDSETGVTSLSMTEKQDAGPILLSKAIPIGDEETTGDLFPRLARLAGELIVETLHGMEEGALQPKPQDEARSSIAPSIEAEAAPVDWKLESTVIARRARAYYPTPGVITSYAGRDMVIVRAKPAEAGPGEPGVILQTGFDGVIVACGGKTRLRITQIQPADQRPMSPSAFVSKYRVSKGSRFD